jgi:SAM-dependent methyltransferase
MQDLEPIYAAMQREKVGDMTLLQAVGGGDPREIGQRNLDILASFGLLQPSTRILDLGCGCGRLAVSLTQVLAPSTRYVGTDIVPDMADFCRREISSRWPNFEFYSVGDEHPFYGRLANQGRRPSGLLLEDTSSLDGQFDLVIASSVFTHLDEAQAQAMLRRVRAWLAPGGSALLTFFLLNTWSRSQIQGGQTEYFYGMDLKAPLLKYPDNAAVGMDEALVERMVISAGFPGIFSVNHGTWTNSPGAHLQDFIVLKRDGPAPFAFVPERYLALNPDVAAAGMDAKLHWERHGKKEGRRWR